MKYAYIAGPYSAKTTKQMYTNIKAAWKVGFEIAKMGLFPIIPHCNSSYMDHAQPHEFWIKGDIELMKRAADMVILMPGWKDSPGAIQEREAAMGFGLSVYEWPEDKEQLESWRSK